MEWFLKVMRQYTDFNGRARRKEYWMFYLFSMIFALVTIILDNVLGIAIANIGYGPLYIFYSLAIFIPSFAVIVRRLNDVNKSGWMFFVVLVLICTEGDLADNKYGPNPKQKEGMLTQA